MFKKCLSRKIDKNKKKNSGDTKKRKKKWPISKLIRNVVLGI